MHKAPASIGLGTYLLSQNLRGWGLSKYLLAFTSACPIATAVAYFGLSALDTRTGSKDQASSDLMFWVGILLLISAGSFLYVALIHILPEVLGSDGGHSNHGHG